MSTSKSCCWPRCPIEWVVAPMWGWYDSPSLHKSMCSSMEIVNLYVWIWAQDCVQVLRHFSLHHLTNALGHREVLRTDQVAMTCDLCSVRYFQLQYILASICQACASRKCFPRRRHSGANEDA